MKQSELNYKENGTWCVWVEHEGIEFYWERFSREVSVRGRSYDCKLWIDVKLDKEPDSKGAKKAIVKWLSETFGV
jgi:hypothetical protein